MRYVFVVFFILLSSVARGASEAAQSFTLDGTLYSATNFSSPLSDPAAVLKIEILDPSKNCVLYEETQAVNTTASDGKFNIQVGSETLAGKRSGDDPNLSMATILQNTTAMATVNAGCPGSTYTPSSGDIRYLRVTLTPSATSIPEVMSPDMTLSSVPTAIMAESVQGLDRDKLLEIGPAAHANATQSNFMSMINGSDVGSLHNHDGTYATLSNSGSITMGANQTIELGEVAGTPGGLGAGDAGKMWIDTTDSNKVKFWDGTSVIDLTSGGGTITSVFGRTTAAITAATSDYDANQIDNAASGNISATDVQAAIDELDAEKLALAGGTMSGSLNMGTNTITNVVNPTNAQDAATKDYVDSAITTNNGSYVARAGDSMTGALTLNTQNELRFADDAGGDYISFKAPAGMSSNFDYTLPPNYGTNGHVLTTDGAGGLTWQADDTGGGAGTLDQAYDQGGAGAGRTITVDTGAVQLTGSNAADETLEVTNSAGGGVALFENTGAGLSLRVNDEAADTTPFVVDADGNVGVGTTAPSTKLDVHGRITADVKGTSAGDGGSIVFEELDANGQNFVGFRAPDTLAGDVVWELPAADGTANQVLQTDGSGVLSWATAATGDVSSSTTLTAGTGLTGGGDLSTNRTFDVVGGDGIVANTNDIAVDFTADKGLHFVSNKLEVEAGTGITLDANGVNVDVGTTANKIVQLNGSAELPAVDGSNLTNVSGTDSTKVAKSGDTMTGDLTFSDSQKIIGGTATTADLTFQTTTGVGATGADMHFLVGNNGATEAMTILNNGKVGFGTTSPTGELEVSHEGDNTVLVLRAHGFSPHIRGYGANGTKASPTATLADDLLLSLNGRGRGATGWSTSPSARIRLAADENWTDTAQGARITFNVTPNGTTTDSEAMRIDHNGSVGIGAANPDASALLDVSSTTKGFLPPRMTTTERDAISSPADGLFVYNTSTDKLNVVENGAWAEVGGGGFGSGNSGFVGSLYYAGVTNCGDDWARGGNSYGSFTTVDSQCNTPVVEGAASAPAEGKIPAIKFASLPAGRYQVIANGHFRAMTAGICHWQLFDGTTAAGYLITNNGNASRTSYIIGDFKYTSAQTNLTFYIQSADDSSGATCNIQIVDAFRSLKFTVIRIDGQGTAVQIADDDGDTGINSEESSDEDILRFDTAGTERMTINASGAVNMTGGLTANSFTGDGSALTNIGSAAISDNSVAVGDLDFASTNGINIPQLASDPGSPTNGQIYYNTGSNKLMVYNGSAWVDTSTGGDFMADGSVAMTDRLFMQRTDTDTYASSSGSSASPSTVQAIFLTNDSHTDSSGNLMIMKSENAAGTEQSSYIGSISESSGNTPTIVLGQQTGASSYAESMRIDSSGNVGIGATTLAAKLHVSSGTGPHLRLSDGSNNWDFNAGSNLSIRSDHLFLSSGRKVGIDSASANRDLSFGSGADRTIWIERGVARSLTVQGGGVTAGTTDGAGGDLLLASGIATGTGTSDIHFQTATAQGSSSNTDNAPTTKMTIVGDGSVGIGTTSPDTTLAVEGTIRAKASVSNATTTVDFATGNLQHTTQDCQSYALHNMKDGASYTFAVQGATSATCAFTAFSGAGTGALTVHLPPDHAATTASKHTLYTFLVMGSDVYVAWIPGY